ncbi:sensor histidine kinase [Roseimarinus sediminis]|uniref:sensor histidine kinase n=1 Tax=Roseimarinus sediminis TaxID=1610899 RepID=UPI003D1AD1D7
MELDILSLMFVSGLALFFQAVFLYFLSAEHKRYGGLKEWTLGIVLLSLGLFVLYLRSLPEWELFSILLSNVLLIGGLLLMFLGSIRFLKAHFNQNILWLIYVLFLLSIVYFTLINENLNCRVILFSLVAAIFYSLMGWVFLRFHTANFKRPAIVLSLIFFLNALIFTFRFLYHLKFNSIASIFENGTVQVITYLTPAVFGILWNFILIIIINQRLYGEVSEQSAELKKMNAEKDRFFAILAHDLRGPFASVLNLSSLLADKNQKLPSEQYKQIASSLEKTAISTSNLLENLLEWSGFSRGTSIFAPLEFAFGDVMNPTISSLKDYAKAKNIQLNNEIDDRLKIVADERMFQMLFRNLVGNAIKFTPANGSIKLTHKHESDGSVLFAIHDTGIGMEQQMVDTLFTFDSKNSRRGTDGEASSGLGLQLCREIAERHNGKIWVESTENLGSTFFFKLGTQLR